MKYHVLGSGSQGNSLLIQSREANILIDCGLSIKKIKEQLDKSKTALEDIDVILITHGHIDHIKSVSGLSNITRIYMSEKLFEILDNKQKLNHENIICITNQDKFNIKNISIQAFPVVHDCIDPMGFVVSCDQEKYGIITDIGKPTDEVRFFLSGCTRLFIESNYDIELLMKSDRPWFLKNRILKNNGHLSNVEAGKFIAEMYHPDLKEVMLMHLSDECNNPDIALDTVFGELRKKRIDFENVRVALQGEEMAYS